MLPVTPYDKAIATLLTAIVVALGRRYLHLDIDQDIRAALEIVLMTWVTYIVPNKRVEK